MSNTPPPSAAPERAAARSATQARVDARWTVFEHVAAHGSRYLAAHCWGHVREFAAKGYPADLVAAVVAELTVAHDEVVDILVLSGIRGVQAALDVERAAQGGAS